MPPVTHREASVTGTSSPLQPTGTLTPQMRERDRGSIVVQMRPQGHQAAERRAAAQGRHASCVWRPALCEHHRPGPLMVQPPPRPAHGHRGTAGEAGEDAK